MRPDQRDTGRWLGLGLLAVLAAACTRSTAELPLVAFDAARVGTKMLRPGARAAACRTTLLGIVLGGGSSPLAEALGTLRGLDPEADALVRVRVDTTQITSGLLNRTCVSVEADVVRVIPVVRLPAAEGHHGHH